MICLDTNYLILGLVDGSVEANQLIEWSDFGETFCTASTAWYEFLCGPINAAQVTAVGGILQKILPFDDVQAREAARLYNATGRKRSLRIDAMIASAAISNRVPLATNNHADFAEFVPLGLLLRDAG